MFHIDLEKLDSKTRNSVLKYVEKHPEYFEVDEDGELYLKEALDDVQMAKMLGVRLRVIKRIGGLNPWEVNDFDWKLLRFLDKSIGGEKSKK